MWYRGAGVWGLDKDFCLSAPRAEVAAAPLDGAWGPEAVSILFLSESLGTTSCCVLGSCHTGQGGAMGVELLLPPPTPAYCCCICFDIWSLDRLKTDVSTQGR